MSDIKKEFLQAQQALETFISDEKNFRNIEDAGNLLVKVFQSGGKVISCGNGGSMCDAMHFAEELSGRFRDDRPPLAAMAISDPSYISCVANDYGYDKVFSRYVSAFGKSGDVLLAISTSGNSKNVIEAINASKSIGVKVIGLTGKDGGVIAELCDIEIRAPHSSFSDRAQEIHIKVIHTLILYVEKKLFGK